MGYPYPYSVAYVLFGVPNQSGARPTHRVVLISSVETCRSFRKLFGVLIIRILLFRVLY